MLDYKLTLEVVTYFDETPAMVAVSLGEARAAALAGKNVYLVTTPETAAKIWEALPLGTHGRVGAMERFSNGCIAAHRQAQDGWYAVPFSSQAYGNEPIHNYFGIAIAGVVVNKVTGAANETATKRINKIFDVLAAL